jgi:hypothetical protein
MHMNANALLYQMHMNANATYLMPAYPTRYGAASKMLYQYGRGLRYTTYLPMQK